MYALLLVIATVLPSYTPYQSSPYCLSRCCGGSSYCPPWHCTRSSCCPSAYSHSFYSSSSCYSPPLYCNDGWIIDDSPSSSLDTGTRQQGEPCQPCECSTGPLTPISSVRYKSNPSTPVSLTFTLPDLPDTTGMNGMLLLDNFRIALQAGEFGIASGTVVQNKVTLTTTKDEQADGTSVWYHIQGEISANGAKWMY